ncbi:AAA family ATPase [Mucilaginibacter rigui]|uniref:AAA family ATPase n=1 Tax=Mucilaginibacter rigui TaxID=534635 RepID=A0ABR7X5I2_9SPHI|nr:AAA family ATPase [Mucilaginibacter rigui]MBD1385844.1 AAA family ATPase [Mucilaginibacter rigui]
MNQLVDFSHSGFKLIAIRILPGCDEKYTKILSENEIYHFYNNYSIDRKNDSISVENLVPDRFYDDGRKKNNQTVLNISAIVGKNGSGKSTLIELLFRAINNIAQQTVNDYDGLETIKGLNIAIYFQTNSFYKVSINDGNCRLHPYYINGRIKRGKGTPVQLQDFFYNIAVNYSHYAYNVDDFEDEINWLDGLFHKNDGYQTPLVINPLRTNGNIDINSENVLVRARLISNLISPFQNNDFSYRDLTSKHRAHSLKLSLKPSKEKQTIYKNEYKDNDITEEVRISSFEPQRELLLEMLNKTYLFNYHRLNREKYKIALDYIIYKLVSICVKYADYYEFLDRYATQFYSSTIGDFIARLIADDSHITFKLKQTLNFLRFEHIPLETQEISIDRLSKIMLNLRKDHKRRYIDTVLYIPPPIFDTEIMLELKEPPNKVISFRKLSSGEKQLIYSVSTVLYHLINLESITPTKRRSSYKYVNVILEEVELYFHPEMQREYVSRIINSLSGLNIKRILGINLCFVTHSPFILSDIPNENILFLDDHGQPIKEIKSLKTFGANIHDLLAKNFFLSKGAMGEFAQNKIQRVINQLNNNSLADYYTEKDLLMIINLISEPFLREKLMEMFFQKYDKQKRIEELKNELKRLGYDQA